MKRFSTFLITFLILIIFIFGAFLIYSNKVVIISEIVSYLKDDPDFSVLILGKPGPGYIGSENTDSIIVAYYNKNLNKFFLIPIPRDLIVKDESGQLFKINSLYEKNKINLLLKKASSFTGLKIKNYIVVDLKLVTNLIDFLGGIEVYLDKPVVDALTLYTIPSGKRWLNGYLVELVVRSRYDKEGDFFRIKNQMQVIIALKNKLAKLETKKRLALIEFLEKNRNHWSSNLSKKELLEISYKIRDPLNVKIVPIVFDWPNEFLISDNITINGLENVYGIYPKSGIDNYDKIRSFIKSAIK